GLRPDRDGLPVVPVGALHVRLLPAARDEDRAVLRLRRRDGADRRRQHGDRLSAAPTVPALLAGATAARTAGRRVAPAAGVAVFARPGAGLRVRRGRGFWSMADVVAL